MAFPNVLFVSLIVAVAFPNLLFVSLIVVVAFVSKAGGLFVAIVRLDTSESVLFGLD